MLDLACSLVLVAFLAGVIAVYLARARSAAERHLERHLERVDKDGGSVLLNREAMAAGYSTLQPVGRLLVAAGVSPDAITLCSLGIGVGAGVALGLGHFGLGALLAAVGFLGDALDGLVARATGVASDAGEVLDAAADRWGETAFLAGVAVAYRAHVGWLLLALLALSGAYMVSYATAKAEAMRVDAPRGAMRRVERAVYLTGAALLVPFTVTVAARHGLPAAVGQAPMLAALALVGGVANVSAARRLASVARTLRARDAPRGKRLDGDGERDGDGDGDGDGDRQVRGGLALLARHQAGSLVSTLVDFGTMILAVEVAHAMPAVATALGASAGAVTNFALGRRWIFHSTSRGGLGAQAARYAAVSAASLGLNTAGEYLLAQRHAVPYVLARLCVAVAVSLLWNFPMQRWFVFTKPAEARG